jgi:hypothetical protein
MPAYGTSLPFATPRPKAAFKPKADAERTLPGLGRAQAHSGERQALASAVVVPLGQVRLSGVGVKMIDRQERGGKRQRRLSP